MNQSGTHRKIGFQTPCNKTTFTGGRTLISTTAKNLETWLFRSAQLSSRKGLKLRQSTQLISCVDRRSLGPFRQLKFTLRKNQFLKVWKLMSATCITSFSNAANNFFPHFKLWLKKPKMRFSAKFYGDKKVREMRFSCITNCKLEKTH